jgi:hypothetical protein
MFNWTLHGNKPFKLCVVHIKKNASKIPLRSFAIRAKRQPA